MKTIIFTHCPGNLTQIISNGPPWARILKISWNLVKLPVKVSRHRPTTNRFILKIEKGLLAREGGIFLSFIKRKDKQSFAESSTVTVFSRTMLI